MNKPLDDKALIETRDWCVQRKIDKPHYAEFDDSPKLVTKCDFMISLIDEVLASRATQAGEREAVSVPVAWMNPDALKLLQTSSNEERMAAKIWSYKATSNAAPLYAAPPSLTAVQAENERLREAAEEFCRRVEAGEIRSKRSYAAFKAALAGREKP